MTSTVGSLRPDVRSWRGRWGSLPACSATFRLEPSRIILEVPDMATVEQMMHADPTWESAKATVFASIRR